MSGDRAREEIEDALPPHYADVERVEIADALLPTVRALMAEAAAKALEEAAEDADIKTPFGYALDANGLRDRARALTAEEPA